MNQTKVWALMLKATDQRILLVRTQTGLTQKSCRLIQHEKALIIQDERKSGKRLKGGRQRLRDDRLGDEPDGTSRSERAR